MSEKDKTYFQTFYKMARVINSSLDPSIVLQHIAEETTQAMEAKGCTIRLLGKKGDVLLPKASFGLSQNYVRKGPVVVKSSGVDQEVLAGNVVTIEDPGSDPRFQYPGKAREEGLGSILIMPLTIEGDKVIGVLRVYDAHKRTFTQEEQDFAMAIVNLSALAIQNARMHHQLRKHVELVKAYQYQVFED
ncbi:MAG: GAF domain-containing protein [Desulfoplanes sp.]|nr:GAF domain-containing protein [Desulfoplanes sp.]MDD4650295.1 GAF domain-containing protein [Desulfoplanes sp.]